MEITHRDQFGAYLNELGLVGEGIEIGVCYGGFSRQILNSWWGRKLFLIDPLRVQPAEVYREPETNVEERYAIWRLMLEDLVANYGQRVEWIRSTSEEAINTDRFPDGFFDFIYVDGNHSLEAVTYDLIHWYPKVKKGGLFAGHDMYHATHDGYYCFVEDAVNAFAAERGLPIKKLECSSWYFLKP